MPLFCSKTLFCEKAGTIESILLNSSGFLTKTPTQYSMTHTSVFIDLIEHGVKIGPKLDKFVLIQFALLFLGIVHFFQVSILKYIFLISTHFHYLMLMLFVFHTIIQVTTWYKYKLCLVCSLINSFIIS